MNLNNLYSALPSGIQDIAEEDDRISDDDFVDVLEALESLGKIVIKGDR